MTTWSVFMSKFDINRAFKRKIWISRVCLIWSIIFCVCLGFVVIQIRIHNISENQKDFHPRDLIPTQASGVALSRDGQHIDLQGVADGDDTPIPETQVQTTISSSSGPITPSQYTPQPISSKLHVFYYAWYGSPKFDQKWLHWNHQVIFVFRKSCQKCP
jgi:hypothetical protein